MSKLLALHSLLDPDWLRSVLKSPELAGRSMASDWLEPDKLERCDVRSKDTFLSIMSRSGTVVGSLGLRLVIFWNKDFGDLGAESREFTGVTAGL
jgi:hypothetical protein